MKDTSRLLTGMAVLLLFGGCSPDASYHRQQVQDDTGDRITAGTVQREIRKGMTSSEVLSALGSPNIVTSGEGGKQTWVYDKVATEQVQSSSGYTVFTLIFNPSAAAGARSTNQRTLTIIIKFDENEKVEDYSYRQSSF
jgi:outer membrane protein assembly factor BamE (lipoprotein component of BamABCDE complex)